MPGTFRDATESRQSRFLPSWTLFLWGEKDKRRWENERERERMRMRMNINHDIG